MIKIMVLAGTYQEFKDYVRTASQDNYAYHYVSGINSLHGIEFTNYVICGTFWSREDANNIYSDVCARHEYFRTLRRNKCSSVRKGAQALKEFSEALEELQIVLRKNRKRMVFNLLVAWSTAAFLAIYLLWSFYGK